MKKKFCVWHSAKKYPKINQSKKRLKDLHQQMLITLNHDESIIDHENNAITTDRLWRNMIWQLQKLSIISFTL